MSNAKALFKRRQERVRFNIRQKSSERLRLSVFRSQSHIYVQLIDDVAGKTVCSASSIDKDLKGKLTTGATIEAAREVGKLIAMRAKQSIGDALEIVFDKGGYPYHGRVKAVAEAARENGLKF